MVVDLQAQGLEWTKSPHKWTVGMGMVEWEVIMVTRQIREVDDNGIVVVDLEALVLTVIWKL